MSPGLLAGGFYAALFEGFPDFDVDVRSHETAMEQALNRQWRIARRPEGFASVTDFEWTESSVPRPGPDQALVRNELLSLDPTNRSWMSERETYLPPVNLGDVMRGICVGTVVESNNPVFRVAMPLYGVFGWQDYAPSWGQRPGRTIATGS
ncbi:MAG TPA: hypothetical protein VMN81_06505 [Vicinamibacterales bacterium]|nr:hypothetical protein [Vicinamibacterales bacterium]